MKLTEEQKQNAITAGKDAMKNVYDNPKSKSLKWWERLIWIILAGTAASVASILTGCGMKDISVSGEQGQLTITRDQDTGAIIVVGQRPVKVEKGK